MARGDGDAVAPSSSALAALGGVSYLLLMANWFALAAGATAIALAGIGLPQLAE